MPVQPILQAGARIPRPQPLRCLCEYGHDDGFTIMCQRCFRWCHGVCFGIESRKHLPAEWQCWICAPNSLKLTGADKGQAVRTQMARLERIEQGQRASQFARMEQIPALRSPATNVKEAYETLPSMKSIDLANDHCKPLLDKLLQLLVLIQERLFNDDSSSRLNVLPLEMSSFVLHVQIQVSEWAALSTVKVHIRSTEIIGTIAFLEKDIARFYGIVRRGPRDPLVFGQRLKLADAIGPVRQAQKLRPVDRTKGRMAGDSRLYTVQPRTSEGAVDEETFEGALPYQNLLHVVRRSLQPYTQEIENKIHRLIAEFSVIDPVTALARCRDVRYQLLELCPRDLQKEQKASIEDAIRLDERLISDTIMMIIRSKEREDLDRIFNLLGKDAETFLDLVQTTIESNSTISTSVHRNAHNIMIRLCESSGILPSSLTVHGVELTDQNAVYGGGFADIYKATYKGQEVALKRMRVFQRGPERHKIHRAFCKEALLWKRLQHPHLLPFIGVDGATFSPLLCMVSPWMERGTLNRYIAEHPHANLEELLRQTAEALRYLHSKSVVHGDLRGGNILINSDGEACLSDFGLTLISEATGITHTTNASGSTRWMAPELHDPESFGLLHFTRTPASDVYAFACVCLEAYTGAPPFSKVLNDSGVLLRVIRGDRPERPIETKRPLADGVWSMITQAWAQQPIDRPPISIIADILAVENG